MGMVFVANKKTIALEEATNKKESSKFTKLKRVQKKMNKVVAKELKAVFGASNKAFKKTWEPLAVKEAGQNYMIQSRRTIL
jgi:hypothetical protein